MFIFLFVLWSIADLVLTVKFHKDPGFSEFNPIANYFLQTGIIYLIQFKTLMSCIVVGCYQFVTKVKNRDGFFLEFFFVLTVLIWAFHWTMFFGLLQW